MSIARGRLRSGAALPAFAPRVAARGREEVRSADAVTGLTVYLVLLIAIPSNSVITPLANLGRPSQLWALALGFWWLLGRLGRTEAVRPAVTSAARWGAIAFTLSTLVSFALAQLRGVSGDTRITSISFIVMQLSWLSITLYTVDGVRTLEQFRRLLHRCTLAGVAIAGLGLVQFALKRPDLGVLSLPGLTTADVGAQDRGGFTRAAGTSSHPLEYAAVLVFALTLALAVVLAERRRASVTLPDPAIRRRMMLLWVGVALAGAAALVSVSRSALLGVAAALVAILPAVPRDLRWKLLASIPVAVVVIGVAVPGMLGTLQTLFLGVGSDSSAESRENGAAAAAQFILGAPFFGEGGGVFGPQYYIFDNGWISATVAYGLVGTALLGAMFIAAAWSAWRAGRVPGAPTEVRSYGQGLIAALTGFALLFATFDALGFAQAAGLLFLLVGLCGALQRAAHTA